VGCTIIEMATGRPPWADFSDPVAALFHIGSSNDVPAIPPSLSADGRDFLSLCFQRNPSKRPTAIRLLQHRWIANLMHAITYRWRWAFHSRRLTVCVSVFLR
jgi:serine/threonine protein kinase